MPDNSTKVAVTSREVAEKITEFEWQIDLITDAIDGVVDSAQADIAKKMIDELPTSWLDPLLTGPQAVLKTKGGTWGCPEVEAVLRGVKARLEAVARDAGIDVD
jgi:hypothetical protein